MDRHQTILELLRERPFASVRDLQTTLDVSASTIRRDIDRLDDLGLARKVYGGVATHEGPAQTNLSARPFDENLGLAVEAKHAIAREAEKLVRDGDRLIVHAGSTCYALGVLLARRNVKLFTNSVPLAAYLGKNGTCNLNVAGGEVHREPGTFYDPNRGENPFFASRLFLGAQGIGPAGLLESYPLIVRLTTMFAAWVDEIIVMVDSRKFDIHARILALPFSRVGTLITDENISDIYAKMLEDQGVDLRVVAVGAEVLENETW